MKALKERNRHRLRAVLRKAGPKLHPGVRTLNFRRGTAAKPLSIEKKAEWNRDPSPLIQSGGFFTLQRGTLEIIKEERDANIQYFNPKKGRIYPLKR